MIAITTRSSMRVKPRERERLGIEGTVFMAGSDRRNRFEDVQALCGRRVCLRGRSGMAPWGTISGFRRPLDPCVAARRGVQVLAEFGMGLGQPPDGVPTEGIDFDGAEGLDRGGPRGVPEESELAEE